MYIIKKDLFGNPLFLKRILIVIIGLLTHNKFYRKKKININGTENIPKNIKKNVLFISNHQTYFLDAIGIIHVLNSTSNGNKDNIDNLSYLLNSKDLIKKINLENEIIFNSKKFSRDLIDNLNIKTNLAYGRMFIEKEFSISQSFFQCDANVNLVEEFPVLNFECQLLSKNKRELLKKLKIKNDFNNKELKLRMRGNLNVINKKINFDYIQMDNTYKASKEDLNFFKKSFENTIFDEGFLSMFQIVKLRDYLNEIL